MSQGSANLGAFRPPLRASWGFPLPPSWFSPPSPPRARSLGAFEEASSWALRGPASCLAPSPFPPRARLWGSSSWPSRDPLGARLPSAGASPLPLLPDLGSGWGGCSLLVSAPSPLLFVWLCCPVSSPAGLFLFSLWFWGPRPKDSCGLGLLGYDLWSMIFVP